MFAAKDILKPGAQVRIIRQMPQRDQCWTPSVEGTLLSIRQEPTGAWWAHSKKHKLWLDRALVRMDDGDVTDVVLDEYTRVESRRGAAFAAPPVVDSAAANHAAIAVGRWRWATAFVIILALSALTLAITMMPLHLVGIGAFCFFGLFMWTSLPALVALEGAADHPLTPQASECLVATLRESVGTVPGTRSAGGPPLRGVLQHRAASLPHRRSPSTHKATFTPKGLMP